jgi:hypothetical protein
MTNKEFNKQVELDISKLVKLAMKRYNEMTHLDEEEEDLDEMTQTERDYQDDLDSRYWDMKGTK